MFGRQFSLIARVASGTNALLGAYIMFTPLIYGLTRDNGIDVWVTLSMGLIVMICGVVRLFSPGELPALSWGNVALGVYIALSPWLFRFDSDQARIWADATIGGTVMLLAALSAVATTFMQGRLSRM